MENDRSNPFKLKTSDEGSDSPEAPLSAPNQTRKVADSALVGSPKAVAVERFQQSLDFVLPEWGLPRASFAATGGAVTAVALGLWTSLTVWLTSWTVLNALLGLAMGIWGLKSPRKRVAILGIALNLLALVLILIWRR